MIEKQPIVRMISRAARSCGLAFLCLTVYLACGSSLSASETPDTIKLPEPEYASKLSIEEALLQRRSVRDYKDQPLDISEVSQILWAAQGITDQRGLRTAPSAGALYPLEVYLVAGNVSGLPAGIYRYQTSAHALVKVADGDRRAELCQAALGQASVKKGAAVVVFTAIYERTTGKYGDRGIKYAHIEVGCASQNVYLQAVSLDIGTVFVGAFHDSQVKQLLNLEDNEHPQCIMPLGKK
jgi:SagB-type dehydrogenase family enzyme